MQFMMVGAFLAILAMAIGVGIGWYARDEIAKEGTPSTSHNTGSPKLRELVDELWSMPTISTTHVLKVLYGVLCGATDLREMPPSDSGGGANGANTPCLCKVLERGGSLLVLRVNEDCPLHGKVRRVSGATVGGNEPPTML